LQREERETQPVTLTKARNEGLEKRTDRHPELLDFYNSYDALDVTEDERTAYLELLEGLDARARELLDSGLLLYVIELENIGGLVMPVILEAHFEDDTTREFRVPAEVWRKDPTRVTKLLVSSVPLARVVLDPHLETADADLTNNFFPRRIGETRMRLGEDRDWGAGENPMRKAGKAKTKAEGE
ncbi:MAG: aminopeptidase, partial [Planctomycetota bacterium]